MKLQDIIDFGQNLTGSTKAWVDIQLNPDATSLDLEAATYGLMSAVMYAGEKYFQEADKPGASNVLNKLGIAPATMGVKVSWQQFRDASAEWLAAPDDAQKRDQALGKLSGYISNVGGLIMVVPGGQAIGAAAWLGGSLLENHYNGNFAQLGGRRGFRVRSSKVAQSMLSSAHHVPPPAH